MNDFNERNKNILKLRKENHLSYQKIADIYGISRSRVQQIYIRELRKEKIRQEETDGTYEPTFYASCIEATKQLGLDEKLATRTYRCLNRSGIVRELKSGKHCLKRYSDDTLMSIRNFGKTSLKVARLADDIF